MVLNAGGTVARYFNVVESSGNVFEIWENSEHGITTFQNLGSAKYSGDTRQNFIGDTFAAMLGFFMGDF